MLKKLISLSLAAVLLSTAGLAASSDIAVFTTVNVQAEEPATGAFTYAESKVASVTEDTTTHVIPSTLTAWGGSSDVSKPAYGTGLEGNPLQISNGAELAWFAKQVNAKALISGEDTTDDTTDDVYYYSADVVLTSDINLNKQAWTPIGKNASSGAITYRGTFDGQGHTIYNLKYTSTISAYPGGGLFSYVSGGSLMNLNVVDAEIISKFNKVDSNSYTSAICGRFDGGTISNVYVSGDIKVNSGAYAPVVGGIVAFSKGSLTIENCYSEIDIDLTGVTAASTVDTAKSQGLGVGGIMGLWNSGGSTKTLEIKNCGFGGTINAPKNIRVAGILGSTYSGYWNMENCYNTGNITALKQVAGIIGWERDGKTSGVKPVNLYNTGTITAKSTTSTYAAGIANGLPASAFEYGDFYSAGDVVVDDEDESTPEFNALCGLISTSAHTGADYDQVYGCYVERTYGAESTKKHIIATANDTYPSGANMKACTEEELKSSAILADLNSEINAEKSTDNYVQYAGLNNGYPVLNTTPLTDANTYYVSNDTLTLALAEAGYVSLDITPLGDNVSVTVGEETKAITAEGTYLFAAPASATVTVSGAALIKKDLMAQDNIGGAITALEATAIKAAITGDAGKTIVLALFNGATLEKVVYAANVKQAVIDLRDADVAGKTLKAFVWENDTLAPTDIAIAPLS